MCGWYFGGCPCSCGRRATFHDWIGAWILGWVLEPVALLVVWIVGRRLLLPGNHRFRSSDWCWLECFLVGSPFWRSQQWHLVHGYAAMRFSRVRYECALWRLLSVSCWQRWLICCYGAVFIPDRNRCSFFRHHEFDELNRVIRNLISCGCTQSLWDCAPNGWLNRSPVMTWCVIVGLQVFFCTCGLGSV